MKQLRLTRYERNPILIPTTQNWENLLVFNPGAVMKDGKVHLLYRATGTDDPISRLGHAVSTDGVIFTRNAQPLYYGHPEHPNETLGLEDVRVVNMDGTIMLVYNAVTENIGAKIDPSWKEKISKKPKLGLSTTTNFLDFEDYDTILPDFEAKNGSLFPKKIDGEYALFFRRQLTTYYATSHHLTQWDTYRPVFEHRGPGYWDEIRTGIGPPPVETELGWLLIYHGVSADNTYRLGFMLLDKDDPTQIKYRSQEPILEPEKEYERFGFFPNVVFSNGAVEIDNKYYVYYGAADNVIGLATITKDEVLQTIKEEIK